MHFRVRPPVFAADVLAGLDHRRQLPVQGDIAAVPAGEIGRRCHRLALALPSAILVAPDFGASRHGHRRGRMGGADQQPVAGECQSAAELVGDPVFDRWRRHQHVASARRGAPDFASRSAGWILFY